MVEYLRVNSSNIRDIGYDGPKQELRIIFNDGKEYAYTGVSAEAHKSLIKAPSKGSHFHAHIKGKYDHRLIEDEDEDED